MTDRDRLTQLVKLGLRFRNTPIVDRDFCSMRNEFDSLLQQLSKVVQVPEVPVATFEDFWAAQAEWSQATFGADDIRGPLGPIKHLRKEVEEVLAVIYDPVSTNKELVDCQFLVFDAARRNGATCESFLKACFEKLAINQDRQWPVASITEPVEHIKKD